MSISRTMGYILFAVALIVSLSLILFKITEKNSSSKITKEQISPSQEKQTSSADLSYIIVVADEGTKLTLLNEKGNSVGEAFLEESPYDMQTGKPVGDALQSLQYAKPATGKYKLIAQRDEEYTLDFYLYDNSQEGESGKMETLKLSGSHEITIYFDKLSVEKSTIN